MALLRPLLGSLRSSKRLQPMQMSCVSSAQKKLRLLSGLELEDTRVYPLPGGTGRRWTSGMDPRLKQLHKLGGTPTGDTVVFYEDIASIRDKRSKLFYIAFRETVDAQLARESDLQKYPEWLMKTNEKQRERLVHIYVVLKHPKDVAVMRTHEDWLGQITDTAVFDALWTFLSRNGIVSA